MHPRSVNNDADDFAPAGRRSRIQEHSIQEHKQSHARAKCKDSKSIPPTNSPPSTAPAKTTTTAAAAAAAASTAATANIPAVSIDSQAIAAIADGASIDNYCVIDATEYSDNKLKDLMTGIDNAKPNKHQQIIINLWGGEKSNTTNLMAELAQAVSIRGRGIWGGHAFIWTRLESCFGWQKMYYLDSSSKKLKVEIHVSPSALRDVQQPGSWAHPLSDDLISHWVAGQDYFCLSAAFEEVGGKRLRSGAKSPPSAKEEFQLHILKNGPTGTEFVAAASPVCADVPSAASPLAVVVKTEVGAGASAGAAGAASAASANPDIAVASSDVVIEAGVDAGATAVVFGARTATTSTSSASGAPGTPGAGGGGGFAGTCGGFGAAMSNTISSSADDLAPPIVNRTASNDQAPTPPRVEEMVSYSPGLQTVLDAQTDCGVGALVGDRPGAVTLCLTSTALGWFENGCVRVCCESGYILGRIVKPTELGEMRAEVEFVWVFKKHRGGQFGEMMLSAFVEELRKKAVSLTFLGYDHCTVYVTVTPQVVASMQFWRANGFVPVDSIMVKTFPHW